MVKTSVGSHSFEVPKEYLIESRPFWLPKGQDHAMIFVLSPQSALKDRVIVTLQERQAICAETARPEGSAPLCAQVHTKMPGREYRQDDIKKVMIGSDNIQWKYVESGSEIEKNRTIATCFKKIESDGKGGFCSTIGKYKDLDYIIMFRESEMLKTPLLHEEIANKLGNWES